MENTLIKGYHAHVYFDGDSTAQARVLRGQIDQEFACAVGRFHEKKVGPHPCWSFQVAFKSGEFGIIVPWLALNRKGLTVFVHAVSGDDIYDHTELVMWLGESVKINLEAL